MFSKEITVVKTEEDYVSSDSVCHAVFTGDNGHECMVQVMWDREPFNCPRDWDNMWSWVTTQKAGYSDRNPAYKAENAQYPGSWSSGKCYTPEMFEDGDGRLNRQFLKDNLVVPLYLYRHSGDVISAGRFERGSPCDCPWDSGCMGFAFVPKEKAIRDVAGKYADGKWIPKYKAMCKAVKDLALKQLEAEVRAMNKHCAGEVYGIQAVDMVDDCEESCWGYLVDGKADAASVVADMVQTFLKDRDKAEKVALECVEGSFYG